MTSLALTMLVPHYLWLLLAIPLIWFVPRRLADVRHGLIRSALLALLILGLAQPVFWTDDDTRHLAVVWDRSASLDADAADRAARAVDLWLTRQPSDARIELIEVGAEELATSLTDPSRIATRTQLAGGSDLPVAIERAAQAIPDGARGAVVVLSDGRTTSFDWSRTTQALTARGIPVHAVTLPATKGDVVPVSIVASRELRVGQTASIEVEIVADSALVEVGLSDGERELARVTDVRVDGRGTAVLTFEPESAGFLSLAANVIVTTGSDADPSNNLITDTFPVQEPLKVLYVGERVLGGDQRLGDLVGNGFRIEDSARLADAPLPPDAYDVIMIDDRAADSLPDSTQTEFMRAVRDHGVGLVMSGGGAAFGPGGYHDSIVAEALPVKFVQKEEKRDPSTTLVVIIDTSGSMGGNRVQLAKEVARLAIRRLLPHDKVGIVEFYGAKRWAAPIQPASNAIDIQRALNRLDAGGGTVILPAIEESFYALQNVQTRYKHVLVLTDGGVETGPFEALLRRMADKGITSSTVLVGPDTHSEFLVNLANWGKGRFYSVPNRFNLPEVLLKQPNTSRIPAYRPGVHNVRGRGGPGWWGDVDRTELPPIAGYVETRSRPGAEVLVETTNGAHPVLATWQYGLGRVTAMTTEPTGPGTEPWRDWDGYGPLMARVLTRTAADSRSGFEFSLTRDDHRLTVRAERRVRLPIRPAGDLLGVNGEPTPLVFRTRADGVFESTFVAPPEEEVRVLARTDGRPRSVTRLVARAHSDRAAETQVDPQRALDLDALAATTGGDTPDLVDFGGFVPTVGGPSQPPGLLQLWPWCLALALLGYLGDLAYRRRPGAA